MFKVLAIVALTLAPATLARHHYGGGFYTNGDDRIDLLADRRALITGESDAFAFEMTQRSTALAFDEEESVWFEKEWLRDGDDPNFLPECSSSRCSEEEEFRHCCSWPGGNDAFAIERKHFPIVNRPAVKNQYGRFRIADHVLHRWREMQLDDRIRNRDAFGRLDEGGIQNFHEAMWNTTQYPWAGLSPDDIHHQLSMSTPDWRGSVNDVIS